MAEATANATTLPEKPKSKMDLALEMRIAGKTVPKIAAELKIKSAAVRELIKEALEVTVPEHSEQLRQIELDRLDAAQDAIWPKVLSGQVGAVKAFLKIQERRTAFTGLDIPKRKPIQDPADRLAALLGADPQQFRDWTKGKKITVREREVTMSEPENEPIPGQPVIEVSSEVVTEAEIEESDSPANGAAFR